MFLVCGLSVAYLLIPGWFTISGKYFETTFSYSPEIYPVVCHSANSF